MKSICPLGTNIQFQLPETQGSQGDQPHKANWLSWESDG